MGLAEAASGEGFTFAQVDAAETRVHMIDQIFFAVVRQIDWDRCTTTFRQSLEGVAVMTADPVFERYDVEVVPAR